MSNEVSWNEGEHSGLVELPDGRSLFLVAAGPARSSSLTPAIIIEHGVHSSRHEWLEVQRRVSRFARVYIYERAGYHTSSTPADDDGSDDTPAWVAVSAARDLHSLLSSANIPPPYILVGHSLGGLLIRRFLVEYGTALVAGLVLVDAAPIRIAIPPNFEELLGDDHYCAVVGLDDNVAIPQDEYEVVRRGDERCARTAQREYTSCDLELERLHREIDGRQLLGTRTLSVIYCNESTDLAKAYENAVRKGHGLGAAQEDARKRLEDMATLDEASQRAHLTLSSRARFVKAQGKQCTHNIHVVDPELVSKEIEWVWQESGRGSSS